MFPNHSINYFEIDLYKYIHLAKFQFPDGSTYEGEWTNGFMNGEGTFTWSDGKQKSGTWINGKLQE